MLETVKNITKKTSNKLENSPSLFAITVVIEFIIFILIAYRWNPYNISDKYPGQVVLFFLIILFIQIVNFFFIKEKNILNKQGYFDTPGLGNVTIKSLTTLSVIALVIVIVIALWRFIRNIHSIPTLHNIITWTLNIIIISGVLGFIYLISSPFLKQNKLEEITKKNTIWSFIINVVLYIPCLFIKFADYLKYQFNITTKTTWIILLLEIIFIGLRIILPEIWRKIVTHDGQHLLREPVYLNHKQTLGDYESLHKKNKSNNIKNGNYKYNYSLSAWFYLNPQPPNTNSSYTKYTNILNYGQKPLIQYNGKFNSLRIQTEIKDGDIITVYETNNIKYQRWNNIVVNYDGGHMDIFINGDLVGTRKNVAPYMSYENVIIGADNGLYGGICNIVYYDHILSRSNINLVYKSLRDKYFPII